MIRDAVLKELEDCANLDAAHIIVGVTDDVVELAGYVTSLAEVHSANRAALRVAGVTAVANDLSVHPPFQTTRLDRQIAAAVRDAIVGSAVVPPDLITITVRAHVVTLAGQVDDHFQRQEAQRIAAQTQGVRRVENEMTLP